MMFTDEDNWPVDKGLSDFEVRLFLFICWNMDKNNQLRLMQDEIATMMHVHRPKVTRALNTLRAKGYISTPRRGLLLVDPHLAWKDKLAKNKVALSA